jgi:glutathione S-transferase
MGQQADEAEIESGIAASERAVQALEALAGDGGFLIDDRLSLADLHLAPMMAYFTAADEGCAVLSRLPKLSNWWNMMRHRPALVATDPR